MIILTTLFADIFKYLKEIIMVKVNAGVTGKYMLQTVNENPQDIYFITPLDKLITLFTIFSRLSIIHSLIVQCRQYLHTLRIELTAVCITT